MPKRPRKQQFSNILKRINPESISFKVNLRAKGRRYYFTFYDEDEARTWLREFYDLFRENPEKYAPEKSPKW